jgi:hypothetical protein
MPPFDELSVKALWPDMKNHEEFMKYFPSKFPVGRLPDRKYFFNIMNTVMEEYVAHIIKHANNVRATKAHNTEAAQTIEITDEWYEKLSAIHLYRVSSTVSLTFFRTQGKHCTSAEVKCKASSTSQKEEKDLNHWYACIVYEPLG